MQQVHYLNPAMLRDGGFGIITICRPLEKEKLLKELSPRFQNLAIIVEDSTILTAKHEKISSAMVSSPSIRRTESFRCHQ